MKNKDQSRRKFISTSALALTGITAFGSQGFDFIQKVQTEKVRVGLIGSGSRGLGLAQTLANVRNIELVACCDIVEEHLKAGLRVADKDAKGYFDYQKLIDDPNVRAVIIATPLYLHFPMAVAALKAGKHVYVEKTMAYDIPQTLHLVKLVDSSNLVFQVGHQYRYYSMYHKVKEIIDKGWIGKVFHYECQYNRNSDWRQPLTDPKMERAVNWKMYKEYCGGLLSELSAHEIDMVNMIQDSHPIKVAGFGGIDFWKDGRDNFDNIRLVYEYPGGVKSSVTSILTNEYKGYSIRILGTRGTIEILRDRAFIYAEAKNKTTGTVDGVTGATVEVSPGGAGEPIVFQKDNPELDPTVYALRDFAECILTGKKPASNVRTGKDVAIAVHMGNKAAETETTQYWKSEYDI